MLHYNRLAPSGVIHNSEATSDIPEEDGIFENAVLHIQQLIHMNIEGRMSKEIH